MSTEYRKGQFIAISYWDNGKTLENQIFKIEDAQDVAIDGAQMLVDGIDKALGRPLAEGVERRTELWCVARDGSKHRFTPHFYPHKLYIAGTWKTIKA